MQRWASLSTTPGWSEAEVIKYFEGVEEGSESSLSSLCYRATGSSPDCRLSDSLARGHLGASEVDHACTHASKPLY